MVLGCEVIYYLFLYGMSLLLLSSPIIKEPMYNFDRFWTMQHDTESWTSIVEIDWDQPGGIFSPGCPYHPCLESQLPDCKAGCNFIWMDKLQFVLTCYMTFFAFIPHIIGRSRTLSNNHINVSLSIPMSWCWISGVPVTAALGDLGPVLFLVISAHAYNKIYWGNTSDRGPRWSRPSLIFGDLGPCI